jgi:septal ring factor EnvC (AmiA/AmiB activator)
VAGRGSSPPGPGRRLTALLAAGLLFALAAPARAQQQPPPQSAEAKIRAQRDELDRIRREREELQQRMSELQGKAHDLSEEVTNIHRQADATARVVKSLDVQLVTISTEVDGTSASLVRAEDELAVKKAVLHRRVVDIYKRGPLYSTEALLSAASFGQLIARYKYLHELAMRDRALVERVDSLYQQTASQRKTLVRLQAEFERNRQDKIEEERRLRVLEEQRSRSLAQVKQSTKQAEQRLGQIQRDEARLSSVIASFEDARRRAEARPNAAPMASTLKTSDFGKLDWPVEGTIIYRFGRAVSINNTAIRWNGVGIAASAGAPVHSVASGEVMVASPLGTYGMTVIVQHGGGDYSVYGSLARADVQKGQQVIKGQVIGQVGVSDPELPAHLHFEIRPKGHAMDPLAWLRGERK